MASKAAEKCEGYWSLGKQDAEMDPLGWVSTSRKVTWYRDHFCRRGKMKAEVKGRMFSKEGKKKISNGFQPDTTSFLKVKTSKSVCISSNFITTINHRYGIAASNSKSIQPGLFY